MEEKVSESDQFFRQVEVAKRLGISPRTLERHRVEGTGPRFCKLGRRVLYRWGDVLTFLERKSFFSTKEAALEEEHLV